MVNMNFSLEAAMSTNPGDLPSPQDWHDDKTRVLSTEQLDHQGADHLPDEQPRGLGLAAMRLFGRLRPARDRQQNATPEAPRPTAYQDLPDDGPQSAWYTEKYPDSVSDFGEAEVMAYASKFDEEDFLYHKQKAKSAEAHIGERHYRPEDKRHISAEAEAREHIQRAREARASADRFALSASEVYRLRQEL